MENSTQEYLEIDIKEMTRLLDDESFTMPSNLNRDEKLAWLNENRKKIMKEVE